MSRKKNFFLWMDCLEDLPLKKKSNKKKSKGLERVTGHHNWGLLLDAFSLAFHQVLHRFQKHCINHMKAWKLIAMNCFHSSEAYWYADYQDMHEACFNQIYKAYSFSPKWTAAPGISVLEGTVHFAWPPQDRHLSGAGVPAWAQVACSALWNYRTSLFWGGAPWVILIFNFSWALALFLAPKYSFGRTNKMTVHFLFSPIEGNF